MKEIIVAKNSSGPLKAIVLICLIIVTGRSWAIWWPVRFLLLAATFTIAYVAVERYSRMKLSVTADKVHVVNFNSKFTLQLDSVKIDDEKNHAAWPQDDFVRFKDGAMRNQSADEDEVDPLDLSVNDLKPGEEATVEDDGEVINLADVTNINDAPSAQASNAEDDDAADLDGQFAELLGQDTDEEFEEDLLEDLEIPEHIPTTPVVREVKKARSLILTDASGTKAQVGVAPAYGTRLDEIAEDLYVAIDRMRAINGEVA